MQEISKRDFERHEKRIEFLKLFQGYFDEKISRESLIKISKLKMPSVISKINLLLNTARRDLLEI